jgi:hypothetical protein
MREAATVGRAEDECWHVRKDGSRFWCRGVTTAINDDAGQLRGFAKVMRDETERRQANERLTASLVEKGIAERDSPPGEEQPPGDHEPPHTAVGCRSR